MDFGNIIEIVESVVLYGGMLGYIVGGGGYMWDVGLHSGVLGYMVGYWVT